MTREGVLYGADRSGGIQSAVDIETSMINVPLMIKDEEDPELEANVTGEVVDGKPENAGGVAKVMENDNEPKSV